MTRSPGLHAIPQTIGRRRQTLRRAVLKAYRRRRSIRRPQAFKPGRRVVVARYWIGWSSMGSPSASSCGRTTEASPTTTQTN